MRSTDHNVPHDKTRHVKDSSLPGRIPDYSNLLQRMGTLLGLQNIHIHLLNHKDLKEGGFSPMVEIINLRGHKPGQGYYMLDKELRSVYTEPPEVWCVMCVLVCVVRQVVHTVCVGLCDQAGGL